jgi:hypothetical protein
MKRWSATITFSTDAGPKPMTIQIEELEDLQEVVEHGPDWNSIIDIKITLARGHYPVTVEEAAKI